MVRDFKVQVGARNVRPEVTTEYMVEIDNVPVRNEWTRYTGPIDLNAFNLPQIPNPQGKKLIMRVGGTSIHEAVYYLPDRSVTLPPVLIEPAGGMVRDFKVQVGARNVRPEVTTEYMVEIDNVPVRNEWTRYTGPIDLDSFSIPRIPNPQGKKVIVRTQSASGGTAMYEAVYYLPERATPIALEKYTPIAPDRNPPPPPKLVCQLLQSVDQPRLEFAVMPPPEFKLKYRVQGGKNEVPILSNVVTLDGLWNSTINVVLFQADNGTDLWTWSFMLSSPPPQQKTLEPAQLRYVIDGDKWTLPPNVTSYQMNNASVWEANTQTVTVPGGSTLRTRTENSLVECEFAVKPKPSPPPPVLPFGNVTVEVPRGPTKYKFSNLPHTDSDWEVYCCSDKVEGGRKKLLSQTATGEELPSGEKTSVELHKKGVTTAIWTMNVVPV
eukprot:PhF_6_TR37185/c0_g1_i7/m.54782